MSLFGLPPPSTNSKFFPQISSVVYRQTIDEIVDNACRMYGITLAELRGAGRWKAYVQARRYAIARLREEHGLSSTKIGELLNMDHTTILYHLGTTTRGRALKAGREE